MEIKISKVEEIQAAERAAKMEDPGFGRVFSERMFLCRWNEANGWHDAEIVPYGPLALDPAANVLHYAQEVFEGLKAYSWEDGSIALFRPEKNGERFNSSARRLCMPEVPADLWMESIEKLVDLERKWVPTDGKGSLYIRPTMIGTEPALGVKSSSEYLFYHIVGPVGPYFPSGFKPVRIYVQREFVRAVVGGIGFAKTSGNYAASLLPGQIAREKGCAQVLYLDAKELKYIEELGGMNVYCRFGDTLATSPLTGSILPGITRNSIKVLAEEMGYKVEERLISIAEIEAGAADGTLKEMFAVGTAAVVTAIGALQYEEKEILINDNAVGEAAQSFYDKLTGLQFGLVKDTHGWIRKVPRG